MEKLIIKNFAGLNNIEITINKINIIIGPQASGKSVIAKLLFYFRSFVREIFVSGIERESKRSLDKKLKDLFEKYFPSDSWGDSEFFIQYFLDEEYILIQRQKYKKQDSFKLCLSYSSLYEKSFSKIKSAIKKESQKMDSEDLNSSAKIDFAFDIHLKIQQLFLQGIAESMGPASTFNQSFIPAGRSFFAVFQGTIFTLLSENTQIDPFLIQFGKAYERAKSRAMSSSYQASRGKKINSLMLEISKLKDNILLGKYVRIKGEDHLQLTDGRWIRLSHSSSGQQETLPLVLMLESIFLSSGGLSGTSTYIEEPEAHLFPRAQRDIVNLIATVYNYRSSRLQFFITTHSPYVLTAFNNLIQAGILSKSGHHDQVLEVMPASQILDPDDISAYHVVDGQARNIIDPETQLIDAQIIDSISDELAIQFDQLLDIE